MDVPDSTNMMIYSLFPETVATHMSEGWLLVRVAM